MSEKSLLLLGSPFLFLEEGDVMKVDKMLPGASLFGALGFLLAVVDAMANVATAATSLLSVQAAPGIFCWFLAILRVMFLVGVVTQHAGCWCCGLVLLIAKAFGRSALLLFLLSLSAFRCHGGVGLLLLALLFVFLLGGVSVEGLSHVKVRDCDSQIVQFFFQPL